MACFKHEIGLKLIYESGLLKINFSNKMLDIKFIRENQEQIRDAIEKKNIKLDLAKLLEVDQRRLELMQSVEDLSAQKNALNNAISQARSDSDRNEAIARGKAIKEQIEAIEPEFQKTKLEFEELMVKVPNIISEDTPFGKSDEDNVEIEKKGDVPTFDFEIKDHIQLGKDLDILDLEKGTKVAGFRGYYVKNEGVSLM
ncbi:MAG: hypothetical protein ACD_9C00307G0006, partial [uncultured bacterium]